MQLLKVVMRLGFCRRSRVDRVLTKGFNIQADTTSVLICQADFDVGEQYQAIIDTAPHAGAIVFFVGLVRDFYTPEQQAKVSSIELEHYAGMTESVCQQIIDQAQQRFSFDNARIVHRVGKLNAGDQIVFVAVASRHRDSAFQAAQFIMDLLKTRATFWKKEVGDNGEHWLGVKARDEIASKRWL